MMKRLYVDIHVIQTVPPSCVNRDDTGSPKTATYGGVTRSRVSSQAWKKAVRDEFKLSKSKDDVGIRTLKLASLVADEIKAIDPNYPEPVKKAEKALELAGVTKKGKNDAKAKAKKSKEEANLEQDGQESEEGTSGDKNAALFFMSPYQAKALAKLVIEGVSDISKYKEAIKEHPTVDMALFGRMVADSPDLNVDASCQVAHAISTHAVENEYDYYTAVDDRSDEDNAGASMIGTVEYNSSTMYRYATVAVHGLTEGMGSWEKAAEATKDFAKAFVLSMPTGKQNTFANRTIPDLVMIILRDDAPVNLVNAFEKPIAKDKDGGGFVNPSVKALMDYSEEVCERWYSPPRAKLVVGSGSDLKFQDALSELDSAIMEAKGAT
jgi:CRISPR system Cascade subunit CasC